MNNRINSTRFLNQEELASQLLELDVNEEKYPMGGIPLLTMGNKIYVDATDSHTIIFGATGSKKTRNFAMPSIGIFAKAGESFVVTDPKGELYQRTAGEVAELGYEICCLNLRDMKAGEAWNPLYFPYKLYHNGKRSKAMEMVQELAVMITDEDSNDDKFWTYSTIDVISGFIFYLFETEPESECTLLGLNSLWKRYIERRKTFLNKVEEKFGDTMISNKLSTLNNNSDKTVGSIEAVVSMALNRIMVNEEMINYLSRNNIFPEELAKKKSAVYIIIPDENKTSHFAVSLFIDQLYEALIGEAQSRPGNMLPIRMNFLIDEFANIPKLENMDSMITASRSRNIRFHLIIQSMKQLRHKYAEYADVICSNCNNWVYLYSKEYELLQEISRLCGEVIYDNGIRVPLFSEFDLQHLDKDKGEALVLAGRNFPCLSNLKDVDEYPFAKGEIAPPVRKEAGKELQKKPDKEAEQPEIPVKPEAELLSPEETSVGIVAIGPEKVILLAEICEKEKINECMEKKAPGLTTIYGLSERNISWYLVKKEMILDYEKLKQAEPGFLFSLDSFATYSFLEKKAAEENLVPISMFEFELWKYKGETRYSMVKETIPDYGGDFGLLYAKKRMFRRAKAYLDASHYHGGRWECEKADGGEWIYKKTLIENATVCAKLRGGRNRRGGKRT